MPWQRSLKILQIFHGPLYKTILGHIQMCINLHSGTDTGMTDGFGEGSQVEVGIIFVLDVIVGHISMTKAVDGDGVS